MPGVDPGISRGRLLFLKSNLHAEVAFVSSVIHDVIFKLITFARLEGTNGSLCNLEQ